MNKNNKTSGGVPVLGQKNWGDQMQGKIYQ
jgi:hypothetical protein